MAKASREKGKRGEREAVVLLRDSGFPKAERAVQYCGRAGTAADINNVGPWHVEVKNTKICSVPEWLRQVDRDRNGKPFLILWKQPGGRWLVIADAEDALPYLSKKEDV